MKRGESRVIIKDNKGMQLAVNTIVILVIAILVLVGLLVIWNNQTGIFSNFLKNLAGETNVDTVITSCNSFIARQGVYDYCCVNRNVKYEDNGIKEEKMTCEEMAEKFSGRINKLNCDNAGC